ncbi:hypothetical protein JKP88DRAFT_246842, partial [Tribonema minus]
MLLSALLHDQGAIGKSSAHAQQRASHCAVAATNSQAVLRAAPVRVSRALAHVPPNSRVKSCAALRHRSDLSYPIFLGGEECFEDDMATCTDASTSVCCTELTNPNSGGPGEAVNTSELMMVSILFPVLALLLRACLVGSSASAATVRRRDARVATRMLSHDRSRSRPNLQRALSPSCASRARRMRGCQRQRIHAAPPSRSDAQCHSARSPPCSELALSLMRRARVAAMHHSAAPAARLPHQGDCSWHQARLRACRVTAGLSTSLSSDGAERGSHRNPDSNPASVWCFAAHRRSDFCLMKALSLCGRRGRPAAAADGANGNSKPDWHTLVCFSRRVRLSADAHWDAWIGLLASLAMASLMTELTKLLVGRPRPNYYALKYFGEHSVVDQGSIHDATRSANTSWVSGHSSLSLAGVLFLTLVLWRDVSVWLVRWGRPHRSWLPLVTAMAYFTL